MTPTELISALRRLEVQTGSFACLGCGHEHNCGIHGCAIIREAAEKLGDFNAVFNEDTVAKGWVKMDTAARLKALRKENGFTRQEFATECNIPYSTLTNYENGTRTPPYTFLLTAAKLFGVTIDYLLCATNDPNPALKLAGQCLKVEPGRLRELAEADKDGRLELSEFERHYECDECDAKWATECNACHEEGKIKRPPQSWCYVEEG